MKRHGNWLIGDEDDINLDLVTHVHEEDGRLRVWMAAGSGDSQDTTTIAGTRAEWHEAVMGIVEVPEPVQARAGWHINANGDAKHIMSGRHVWHMQGVWVIVDNALTGHYPTRSAAMDAAEALDP